jgi:peptidoglycan/xylan/chitin deacetylase (PgdA/CDA1 family)
LEDLVSGLDGGDIPTRSVAITIDDGYAADLEHIAPILNRLGIPITVFCGGGEQVELGEPWWDSLARIATGIPDCAEEVRVRVRGAEHAFAFQSPIERAKSFRVLRELLMRLSVAEQTEVLRTLWNTTSTPTSKAHADRLATRTDLRAWAQDPLIAVGGHTVHHLFLPEQPPEVVIDEIVGNRSYLARVTGQPINGFAYPYGASNPLVSECVRAAGYGYALTTTARPVTDTSNRYRLPRFEVAGRHRNIHDWLPACFDREVADVA